MNREQQLQQFLHITGCTHDEAQFFLELSSFDLEQALAAFYDRGSGGPPPSAGTQGAQAEPAAAAAPPQPTVLRGTGSFHGRATTSTAAASTPKSATLYTGGSRVRTLADLGRGSEVEGPASRRIVAAVLEEDDADWSDAGDGEDDVDDVDMNVRLAGHRSQHYYAGGERSGLALEAPGSGSPASGNPLVDEVLRVAAATGRARSSGGGNGGSNINNNNRAPRTSAFTGAGRSLTDPPAGPPSSAIPAEGAGHPNALPSPPPPVKRRLTFWRDGFSIDDGELRSYDDPENREFLAAIATGHAPLHYLNVLPGQEVSVEVAHRRDEAYVPPPPAPLQPFSGAGHRLGAVVPSATTTPSTTPAPSSSTANVAAAAAELTVREDQPTTSLTIRCADGTRVVVRANLTHTIGDVMRVLQARHPVAGRFLLLSPFPRREFVEEGQTLEQAGLRNAALAQKML